MRRSFAILAGLFAAVLALIALGVPLAVRSSAVDEDGKDVRCFRSNANGIYARNTYEWIGLLNEDNTVDTTAVNPDAEDEEDEENEDESNDDDDAAEEEDF